jgi:hypothetical protein
MIPPNISVEHIIRALEDIDNNGIPESRMATYYYLSYKGKRYPPKYVISIANKYANGSELNPAIFSGGQETNNYLRRKGFYTGKNQEQKIISDNTVSNSKPGRQANAQDDQSNAEKLREEKHSERCPRCKATVKAMLEHIFSEVHTAYSLPFGVSLEDYAHSPLYLVLKEIHSSLQTLRGNQEFVRAHSLPPVDYYVPNPGFVVEFDESQHFTACRKVALSQYPHDLPVKFNVKRWMQLCSEINAEDTSPIYRDEQRAW